MKETGPKCHGAIEDVYGILTFATTVLNFELIHLATWREAWSVKASAPESRLVKVENFRGGSFGARSRRYGAGAIAASRNFYDDMFESIRDVLAKRECRAFACDVFFKPSGGCVAFALTFFAFTEFGFGRQQIILSRRVIFEAGAPDPVCDVPSGNRAVGAMVN